MMLNLMLSSINYRFFFLKNSLEGIQAKKILLLRLFHSKDNLQFINGLVLGEKSANVSYLSSFENAGMLHVLVASGFNVSLVAGLAWWMTGGLIKSVRAILVLLAIWIYTAFLEFEPPLLRAAWMFSIAFYLKYIGIKTKRVRILLFSVITILLFQPELLSSLSLWLSALATLGIITFSQRMFMFWSDPSSGELEEGVLVRIKRVFLEEASISFAAQSLIFPLLIWSFSSINLISFLANPVMLPWLGAITQVSGIEYGLSFLDNWWWGRILLATLSRSMNHVFRIYLAGVAWWQHLFFLNSTISKTSSRPVILFWIMGLGIFWLLTRRKQEEKNHFFHEKA